MARLDAYTIQNAMDYLGYVRSGAWTVVINQAFYDENVSVPPGQAITLLGVGGVVLGNGGGSSYSSSSGKGTLTWNLNDSQNVSGATPSLKMQAMPFGYGGYRYMPFISNFTIGLQFATQISGTISSSPQLEFDSLYAFNGMGSPSPIDIGPIGITLRNFRSGGQLNFTSAIVNDIECSMIVPPLACASLGSLLDTNLYDSLTAALFPATSLIKDCYLVNNKTFTAPPVLYLNQASNYWFFTSGWSLGSGTAKVIKDQ